MLAEPRAGWCPIFQDLEQYHSANEFSLSVYREVDSFLSRSKRIARRTREFFRNLGEAELPGMIKLSKLPPQAWKDVLSHSIRDLSEAREVGAERLVFLWDEMPYMLEHIRDREGEKVALEVLDVLRGLREKLGVRMVISGSVGLRIEATGMSPFRFKSEGHRDGPNHIHPRLHS